MPGEFIHKKQQNIDCLTAHLPLSFGTSAARRLKLLAPICSVQSDSEQTLQWKIACFCFLHKCKGNTVCFTLVYLKSQNSVNIQLYIGCLSLQLQFIYTFKNMTVCCIYLKEPLKDISRYMYLYLQQIQVSVKCQYYTATMFSPYIHVCFVGSRAQIVNFSPIFSSFFTIFLNKNRVDTKSNK